MPGSSAQAGPVVGHKDGVDGIGRIVFDAGRKAGNEAVEAHLAFEARDVLRGVIGHAGNGVAVRDQMARAQVGKRTGTKPKQSFAGLLRFRWRRRLRSSSSGSPSGRRNAYTIIATAATAAPPMTSTSFQSASIILRAAPFARVLGIPASAKARRCDAGSERSQSTRSQPRENGRKQSPRGLKPDFRADFHVGLAGSDPLSPPRPQSCVF